MKYAIGTLVWFLHTPDRGVVTGKDPDGMYQVALTDGFSIPAFEDDLCLHPGVDAYAPQSGQKYNGSSGQYELSAPKEPETVYAAGAIAHPRGIYCALEALESDADGMVKYYRLWLCNEMDFAVVANLEVFYGSESLIKLSQKLAPLSGVPCGKLHYDHLNDHPDLELVIQRMTTAGLEPEQVKTIRLRGKTITNTPQVSPLLDDRLCWPLELFSAKTLTGATTTQPEQDLTEYAKQNKPKPKAGRSNPYFQLIDLKEIAAFSGEIDLHIEALMANKARMNNAEILHLQLLHFESFMDKATRMLVSPVYIIHGVGEGVLKAAIAERLRVRPDVAKYKNQYHPKYGYGATEVWFR